MRIEFLIFDLDGTLVETSEDLRDAVNHAVTPFGAGPYDAPATISMVGAGIGELVRKALGPAQAGHYDEAFALFMEYYTAHVADHSKAYPGVEAALIALKDLRKAVLSNKNEALSRLLLDKLGLSKHFDLIAGADTYADLKPSPLPILRMLASLSVPINRAMMIGDSSQDIEAGRRAGLRTVGCAYGFRGRAALSAADFVIDSIEELPGLLAAYEGPGERRKEERLRLPEPFREYLNATVRIGDEDVHVEVDELSEHGLRIFCPVPFDEGTKRTLRVSMPQSHQKEVGIEALIHHCSDASNSTSFRAGGQVTHVDDELLYRVFKNTLSFITNRAGRVF